MMHAAGRARTVVARVLWFGPLQLVTLPRLPAIGQHLRGGLDGLRHQRVDPLNLIRLVPA